MIDTTEYVAALGPRGGIVAMVPFKEAAADRRPVMRNHLTFSDPIVSFKQIAQGHYRRVVAVGTMRRFQKQLNL